MTVVIGIVVDVLIVWLVVSTYRAGVRTRRLADDVKRACANTTQRLRKLRHDVHPGR